MKGKKLNLLHIFLYWYVLVLVSNATNTVFVCTNALQIYIASILNQKIEKKKCKAFYANCELFEYFDFDISRFVLVFTLNAVQR